MVDKWTPAESEAVVSAPVADTTVCTDSSGKRVVDFCAWVVSIFTHYWFFLHISWNGLSSVNIPGNIQSNPDEQIPILKGTKS